MAKDPNVKISRLVHLKDAVVNWLLKDCIKGWIFHNDESNIQAYVVSDISLKTPLNYDPYLEISLDANIPTVKKSDSKNMKSITIGQHALPGTVEEILANVGYMHKTKDLHEQYQEGLKKFQSIIEKPNKQFLSKTGKI